MKICQCILLKLLVYTLQIFQKLMLCSIFLLLFLRMLNNHLKVAGPLSLCYIYKRLIGPSKFRIEGSGLIFKKKQTCFFLYFVPLPHPTNKLGENQTDLLAHFILFSVLHGLICIWISLIIWLTSPGTRKFNHDHL